MPPQLGCRTWPETRQGVVDSALITVRQGLKAGDSQLAGQRAPVLLLEAGNGVDLVAGHCRSPPPRVPAAARGPAPPAPGLMGGGYGLKRP